MRWLLVAAWVATALAATTAAAAWRARRDGGRAALALVLAIGAVPLAVGAWIVGQWLVLRLSLGDANAPVLLGGVALGAHVLGLALPARFARRPGFGPWPVPWAAGALAGGAVTLLLFEVLVAQARHDAVHLRLEAGASAAGPLAPAPAPADDAWLRYLDLHPRLAAAMQGDAWDEDVRRVREGDALEADDAELLAGIERARPILAEARGAARLPDCDFGGRRASARDGLPTTHGSFAPVMDLSGLWLLEGAVAVQQGRTDLALEDVESLLVLSEHAARSPLLIDLMLGHVVREDALELLARILPAEPPSDLPRLRAALPAALGPRVEQALDMERAWFLSSVGLLGEGYTVAEEPTAWASELGTDLFLAFRFAEDVRGYRATMRELRALAEGTLEDLRRARETDAAKWRNRGLLTMLAVPNLVPHLWSLRNTDARIKLAARAIDALAADREAALTRGTWTADDPAWGDEPPSFALHAQR